MAAEKVKDRLGDENVMDSTEQDAVNPFVSICIPSYNKAAFIGETVRSVLSQTYPYYEALVVDNASTDDTRKILESEFGNQIQCHWNETNIGLTGNFNRCVELARHDLLLILCADDILLPNFLEHTVPWMVRDPETGFVATRYYYLDEDSKVTGISPAFSDASGSMSSDAAVERLFELNGGGILMPLYRKKYLQALGGFRPFPGFGDAFSFFQIASLTRIVYINEVLAGWRMFSLKQATNLTNELQGSGRLFEDHLAAFNALFEWFGPESRYAFRRAEFLRCQLRINKSILTSFRHPLRRRKLMHYLDIYRRNRALDLLSGKDWAKLFLLLLVPRALIKRRQGVE